MADSTLAQDILHGLLALAALMLPLLFAWFVLSRTARRHRHPKRKDESMR
ncbi:MULTISPECIES: hypothetical protein [unclassified Variovorax]|nr:MULTISPECIES: hypothetical protein [unclassified Variovorax]MEB0057775.1 hypothetical protein [Variovorax sp. LG9.2]MEB0110856.1 hypothetical protein [Variovorax sp. RTB1]